MADDPLLGRGGRPLRILVTNDDGIYAPGLKVLEHIAHALTDDVWVVAPESEQSGASHSLSLSHPIRLRGNERVYSPQASSSASLSASSASIWVRFMCSGVTEMRRS